MDLRIWLPALGAGLAVAVGLRVLQGFLARRLRGLAGRTATRADDLLADALERTQPWFLIALGGAAAVTLLSLPPRIDQVAQYILVLALGLQVGLWASTLAQGGITLLTGTPGETQSPGTARILVLAARLAIWSVVTLLVLANLGVNITGLVAGLGIGGVAVALAVQAILGDLFASLAIAFDKPFEVGHFIVADGLMGTVERVGLKTTRIRSLSGEQLVLSNASLLSTRIRNYRQMQERRIAFEFGVTYQTTARALRAIPEEVQEIIERIPGVRFDRAHFKSFGDSALIFEVVYWTLDPDYNRYMDVQQEINLALFERVQQLGADFAYPTHTVHLAGAGVT